MYLVLRQGPFSFTLPSSTTAFANLLALKSIWALKNVLKTRIHILSLSIFSLSPFLCLSLSFSRAENWNRSRRGFCWEQGNLIYKEHKILWVKTKGVEWLSFEVFVKKKIAGLARSRVTKIHQWCQPRPEVTFFFLNIKFLDQLYYWKEMTNIWNDRYL